MAYTVTYETLYSDDRKRLIKFSAEISSYSIPDGVEEISINAFKGNKTLKVLYMPSTIKLIADGAFSDCDLEEIHFAGDIKQWLNISWKCFLDNGYRLFFNQSDLVESVIIPESISVIKKCAFYYCTSLQSVIFNKNITTIEDSAFNKSGLRGILSIPKSCKRIGVYAFFCSNITKVKIPETTVEIEYGAFSGCYYLNKFIVSSENMNFYTDEIGLYRIVKTISSNPKELKLIAIASGTREKYCLDKRTIKIGTNACCFSSAPVKGLVIPHTLIIENDAFRDCTSKIYAPPNLRKSLLARGVPSKYFSPIINLQESLITHECPKVFSENPFRILGVYSNASMREIQSNAAKIKRYLEIGKQPSFPTDFNNIFPALNRTQEMVDKALGQISQPKEKLAYALFWFSKPYSNQHHKAINLLKDGDIDKAYKMILYECDDHRIILTPYIYLENINCPNILTYTRMNLHTYAIMVYGYSLNWKEFIGKEDQTKKLYKSLLEEICGDNFSLSEEECRIIYYDKLLTFINPLHIWAYLSNSHYSEAIKNFIFTKSIGKIITSINSQIMTVKAIDYKDSKSILNAAKELKQKTRQDIESIDEYLSPSDVRYASTHDTLSEQILQSAIDSYNYADNPSTIARDVYSLMLYANSLAISGILKKRCAENRKVVKEVVDNLPPEGLMTIDNVLQKAISQARNSPDTIDEAINLLVKVETSLRHINLRIITTNNNEVTRQIQKYFTKVSTIIANVCLNKLIENVNNSHANLNYRAYTIITALNQLPLDNNFIEKRYNENVSILVNNMADGIFGVRYPKDRISYEILDIRPESIVWQQCKKENDYKHYIEHFPNGTHVKEAEQLQKEINRNIEEQRKQQEEQRRQERLLQEQKQSEKKIKREATHLNWAIGILIVLIALQLLYSFWGWGYAGFGLIGLVILFIMYISYKNFIY